MDEPSKVANLYSTLSISSTATASEIKSAYRRLALIHHPDKVAPNSSAAVVAEANDRFQQIGFAYSILKDDVRRKRYDVSGRTEEGEGLESRSDAEWKDYFKQLWKGEVNAETLDEFKEKYQGSEEEKIDLFAAYEECSGSLEILMTMIMCSTVDDEDRFIALINKGIAAKDLPVFAEWKKATKDTKEKAKRRVKASKEATEAEAYAKELGVADKLYGTSTSKNAKTAGKGKKGDAEDSEAGLRALIQSKQSNRMDSLIGSIEARYVAEAQEKKDKKRAKSGGESSSSAASKKQKKMEEEVAEPTDAEFAKLQAEVEARRGKNGGKGK